jgi:hypothetical protein
MRYRFAFGLGRSGTTLLGRLLALTSSPARFVSELCPGIPDRIPNPVFMVEPGDAATAGRVRDALIELSLGKSPFSEEQRYRVERNDSDADVLLTKDIHSLLAYREIIAGLEDWRAVVILRDVSRTLDSYFAGHSSANRRYLVEEYKYIHRHARKGFSDALMDRALAALAPAAARYLRRPILLTSEFLRQAAATEFLSRFLEQWAAADDRLIAVRFEDLCRNPLDEALRLMDFLELEYDDRTLEGIQKMTTGSSRDYYATDKDSGSVLRQPYRFLGSREQSRLRAFLGKP